MITDAKISSAAKISPAKIAPAQVGQLMVAQANGKYAPVTISGDANLAEDGKLRLKNLDEITERALEKAGDYFNRNEEALKRSDLKDGKTLVGGPTTPVEVPVGTGASAIPQRDASGDLLAENSSKLNGQPDSFYLDAANHTYSETTTATDGSGNTTTTTTGVHDVIEFVPDSESSNYPIEFEHLMPYIPDVKVYEYDSSTEEYVEVDAGVSSTAAVGNVAGKVTVDLSQITADFKVVAK